MPCLDVFDAYVIQNQDNISHIDLRRSSNAHALATNEDKKKTNKNNTSYKGRKEQKSKLTYDNTTSTKGKIEEEMPLCPYCIKGTHKE